MILPRVARAALTSLVWSQASCVPPGMRTDGLPCSSGREQHRERGYNYDGHEERRDERRDEERHAQERKQRRVGR
jgi:hypothetical protein